MAKEYSIKVVDVAAEVAELFGNDSGDAILSEWNVPEEDWRFRVYYGAAARITFHRGARAEHVAVWLKSNGLED